MDKFLSLFRFYLTKYLLIWLTLVCFIAFNWENFFGAAIHNPFVIQSSTMEKLIALTMLVIGSLLPLEEVKQVGRRWPTVLSGTCVQYISMPLLAFLVAIVFQLDGPYLFGVILVGCVPGAMASNMLTMISKGNISYSVGLTTSATLLSPVMVPLTLLLCLGKRVDLNTLDIARTLMITVVVPVIVGFTLAQCFRFWQQLANAIGEIVANIVIIVIIASVVGQSQDLFAKLPIILCLALLVLNIGGYLAGFFGGKLIGIDAKMRRALVIEIGMQNAGLGTFLARQYFPDAPEVALCCALYTFGCMFTGIILAQIFRHRKIDEPTASPSSTETLQDENKDSCAS